MEKKTNHRPGIGIVAMLAVFIMSISILSKAFVTAREKSLEAARLSDAVSLASNGADVFLSCRDDKEIYEILNENGNAVLGDDVSAWYGDDLRPEKGGKFRMDILSKENGDFIDADIMVYYDDVKIYEISTGRGAEE